MSEFKCRECCALEDCINALSRGLMELSDFKDCIDFLEFASGPMRLKPEPQQPAKCPECGEANE